MGPQGLLIPSGTRVVGVLPLTTFPSLLFLVLI